MKICRNFSAVLLLLLVSSGSQAMSIEWDFTNSGQTWLATETIFLEATLTNTDTSVLVLGDLDTAINGAGIGHGTFPSVWTDDGTGYEFNFLHNDTLVPPVDDVLLQSGESIDFVFGEYVPVTLIEPGLYITGDATLSGNAGSFLSNNNFTATVVPVPAAVWLFGSGLLFVFGVMKRNRRS